MAKVIREEKRDLVPRILLRMCILLLSILLWYPLPLTVIGEPREYIKKKMKLTLTWLLAGKIQMVVLEQTKFYSENIFLQKEADFPVSEKQESSFKSSF